LDLPICNEKWIYIKKAVQNDELSPFAAAQILLETYFKK
jgi:hypothetical protein